MPDPSLGYKKSLIINRRVMSNHFRYALIVVLAVFAVVLANTPSSKLAPEELNQAKLERLLGAKAILNAEITPRAYSDIYTIKGSYQKTPRSARNEFTITTHLSEAQLNALLARNTARIELPRISTRAKYLDIIPTIVVLALVAGLVAYQVNLGRAELASGRPVLAGPHQIPKEG